MDVVEESTPYDHGQRLVGIFNAAGEGGKATQASHGACGVQRLSSYAT